MKQLFLGSEGTLGIITAATLKLYPDPGETATLFVSLPTANSAVTLLSLLREHLSDQIQAFELMSDRCLRFVTRHIPDSAIPFEGAYPWYVLCEFVAHQGFSQIEDALGDAMGNGLVSDAILAKNESEATRFWRLRHSISEAQKYEGANLKHDISVPIGSMGEFLRRGDVLLQKLAPDVRLVAFGHVGDGNLHYNIAQPAGSDGEQFLAAGESLTEGIYDLVNELGGSISAEHGIGVVKKDHLRHYRSETEIQLMRAMKDALDPHNILNPGKVI